jgi:outer membrane protein
MKKCFLIIGILIVTSAITFAQQKVAYVDTDYILGQIPEYKKAQEELNKTSADWQKEIESKYQEINKMRAALEAEQILLTDDMRKKREGDIADRENEARDLQKKRFGIEGELFRKRQELVKPIQDKVYNAVKAVATKGGYAIVFDKANALTMLYTSDKLDKSDAVLKQMGYIK